MPLDESQEIARADQRASELFGDAFSAIDGCGRREVFYRGGEEFILLGRGGDFDEAFEQAVPFFERFYAIRL